MHSQAKASSVAGSDSSFDSNVSRPHDKPDDSSQPAHQKRQYNKKWLEVNMESSDEEDKTTKSKKRRVRNKSAAGTFFMITFSVARFPTCDFEYYKE